MKKWDGYSWRGVLITVVSLAGSAVEILRRRPAEPFVIVLYSLVAALGILFLLVIRKPKT